MVVFWTDVSIVLIGQILIIKYKIEKYFFCFFLNVDLEDWDVGFIQILIKLV